MNHNEVIEIPLLTTWGYKKYAGTWDISLPSKFICNSKIGLNKAYIEAITTTLYAFSNLARAYEISITPESNIELNVDNFLKWESKENYEEYIDRVLKILDNYPNAICEINIKVDLNAFVYTKKHPDEPIRTWVRYFDESTEMAEFSIYICPEENEPSIILNMRHTLFYPFSYQNNEDNTELFELNQPLLEKAFKSWEKKFNSEIEADGLPGVYKYGYLPQDQW